MTLPIRLAATLALILLFGVPAAMLAQDGFHVQSGIGIGLLVPTAPFAAIDGIPNPGGIQFGSTSTPVTPQFYVGGDMPVASKWRVGGLLGAGGFSMTHEAFEGTTIAGENGGVVKATMKHSLATQWIAASFEPYVRFQPASFLGLHLGLPLQLPFGSDYTQTLEFADPPGTQFVNGSTRITTGAGEVPSMSSIVPSLSLRAEGMIATDSKSAWMIIPWIGVMSTLTSWMSGSSVSTISASLGIGVRHDATVIVPIRDTTYVRDTVRVLSRVVTADTLVLAETTTEEFETEDTIRVVVAERYRELIPQPPAVLLASLSLAFDGTRGDVHETTATFEQQERQTYLPIVPVVRFTRTEVALPARYRRHTAAELAVWDENTLGRENAVHYHYEVLNVVGMRLRNQKEEIVLDVVQPLGVDRNASAGQIREVMRYLVDVIGIDARRIVRGQTMDHTSEYTDIVISTRNSSLMSPIVLTDTTTILSVPQLLIRPQVISELGIRRWEITITHGADTVGAIADTGLISDELSFDVSGHLTQQQVGGSEIEVQLRAEDIDGTVTQTEKVGIHVRGVSNTNKPSLNSRVVSIVRVPSATVNQATSGGFVPLNNTDPLPMNMDLLGPERSLYKGVEMYINKKRQR